MIDLVVAQRVAEGLGCSVELQSTGACGRWLWIKVDVGAWISLFEHGGGHIVGAQIQAPEPTARLIERTSKVAHVYAVLLRSLTAGPVEAPPPTPPAF